MCEKFVFLRGSGSSFPLFPCISKEKWHSCSIKWKDGGSFSEGTRGGEASLVCPPAAAAEPRTIWGQREDKRDKTVRGGKTPLLLC